MKKLIQTLVILFFYSSLFAQSPDAFSYQAVVRDGNGDIVAGQPVMARFSIMQSNPSGTLVYSETHSITTNAFGLLNVYIGNGTVLSGDFSAINWGAASHFLKVEVDITGGGTTYTDMGTTQLMSVPYSLYAAKAGNGFSGDYNDLSNSPANVSHFNNDAGYITSPNDADADPSNEIQTLNIAGNNLSISGGNTVALPTGTTYTAGTGINISGSQIINTAPDQTVALTGGGATSVSGTYPNYTVSSTDNNTTYTAGNGLTLAGTVFSATNTTSMWNASQLQGTSLSSSIPTNGQVLKYNGTAWAPGADNNTTYTAGSGLSLTGTTFTNTAPDQTVSITGSGATTVSGTYPSFTISSTDNNTTYTAGSGLALSGTTFSSTQTLAQTLTNGNSAGTSSINMNNQNITGVNIMGLRATNAAYIDMYYGHIYDYAGSHGIDGQVLRVHGTSPNTYVTWDSPNTILTAGTGLSYSGSTLNTVWSVNGTHIFNNNTGNVGVGLNTPNARLTIKGNSSSTGTEPLFEIKNRAGQTVFIVYEDSVRIYIDDDPSKTNKGAFAVSGRNTSKAFTHDFFIVKPEFSRVFTSDPIQGFGVKNINGAADESYMHINPVNIFIGHEAGFSNTTGIYNSFIGYRSGYANTEGFQNTANGYMTMRNNIGGDYNTAVGAYCLYNNTTGGDNTAVGNNVLSENISGNYNVALGSSALQYHTSGDGNLALGTGALRNNITGTYNCAIGDDAGYDAAGSYNVFIGRRSGDNNTAGNYSAFIGYESGFNSNSSNNVFIGYQAGYRTTGTYCAMIGYQAGFFNTSGAQNTAIGYRALYTNSTASYNTAIGSYALYTNSTGIDNTAVGNNCLSSNTTGGGNVATGSSALQYNVDGTNNTAYGAAALRNNTNGTNNTALGYAAFVNGASYTNSTAIGYNTAMTASNRIAIGNTSVSWIGGQVTWSTYSDARFKKNVNEDVPGLSFIKELRPVTYNYDMDAMAEFFHTPDSLRLPDSERKQSGVKYTGFIAQEVDATAKKLGYNFSGVCKPENSNDFYSIRYAEFTVPLVKSVQELNQKVDNQQMIIEELLQKITELENRLQHQE
jgi:hypothetical protein